MTLSTVHGQDNHTSCATNRYTTNLFTNVSVSANVLYGNNSTVGDIDQNLYMDIYSPEGDTAVSRPLIVLAHGGSFVTGTRTDIADLCTFYAKRGFVAASIDYRLYDGVFPPPDEMMAGLDQMYKGVCDMKAAIRFFREDISNTNAYKIDSKHIYAGGFSAGAIIANHVGYLDSDDIIPELVLNIISNNGGFEGNSSSNTEYSSEVNGIISFSGAILDTNLMENNDTPIFSVHEDNDPIVPFNSGLLSFANFNIVEADGSSLIHAKANSLSITNQLRTVNSNEHGGYLDTPTEKEEILDRSTVFLNSLICSSTLNSTSKTKKAIKLIQDLNANSFKIYDEFNRNFNLHLYHLNGSKILTHRNFKANQDTIECKFPKGVYIILLENNDTLHPLKLLLI
ncbi:alpha/beta hydrolase [Tamlana crocina]